ncbi:MAG: hypothetical protein RLO12_21890 [Fulvivirga sp.]
MKSQTLHTFDLIASNTKEAKTTKISINPRPAKMVEYLKSTKGHNIGLAAFTK